MNEEILAKLTTDLRRAVTTMTRDEARYLTDAYLAMQAKRKAADQQIGAMDRRKAGESHEVLDWLSSNALALEKQTLSALNEYAKAQPMGQWALEIFGVGPVIAAGLLVHIDIEKAPTVGHIWAFAGLDPTKVWKKGHKRPHNAALKQICYYAGECFIRTSNNPQSLYGKLYRERKAYEVQRNDSGGNAARAKLLAEAATPNYKKTAGYKANLAGKLGDGHLNAMARRYAVKQFLADWHAEAFRQHFGKEPPLPYPIAILGHAHQRATNAERTQLVERATTTESPRIR